MVIRGRNRRPPRGESGHDLQMDHPEAHARALGGKTLEVSRFGNRRMGQGRGCGSGRHKGHR